MRNLIKSGNAEPNAKNEYEQQLVNSLLRSAEHIEYLSPPEDVWQGILEKQRKNEQKRAVKIHRILSIAASVFFLVIGWGVWSNYNLHRQFEQVLILNQQLEQQLIFTQLPRYQQASLVFKLNSIDTSLIKAKTTEEKIALLKLRKEIFSQFIEPSLQGNKNEFSI